MMKIKRTRPIGLDTVIQPQQPQQLHLLKLHYQSSNLHVSQIWPNL